MGLWTAWINGGIQLAVHKLHGILNMCQQIQVMIFQGQESMGLHYRHTMGMALILALTRPQIWDLIWFLPPNHQLWLCWGLERPCCLESHEIGKVKSLV